MQKKNSIIRFKKFIFTTRSKKLNRSKYGNLLTIIFLITLGLFSILPMYYAIIQSLKPFNELFIFPPRFYVSQPTLQNFKTLSDLLSNTWIPFSRYLFNSLFVSVCSIILNVLFASAAAYPLAKFKFPGSKQMFTIVVATLLFSPIVTSLPRYIIMSWSGMVNTYFALILPWIGAPLGLFLMKQFMESIPMSIIESAYIDGANEYRTYWSIVIPQVKPALFTLIIFSFQAVWNDQGSQFIFNEKLKMLPAAISQIQSAGIARVGAGAAAAVILMIPPIVIFIISQSNVIETMVSSGLKE